MILHTNLRRKKRGWREDKQKDIAAIDGIAKNVLPGLIALNVTPINPRRKIAHLQISFKAIYKAAIHTSIAYKE